MSLTRSIFEKLNESAEVKKTYGETPQEGKTEKLVKGKKTSIPKGKTDNKVKANKLENTNKEAGNIYPNDTEKVMDKVDSKEQSDKGKIAKQNTTKAERKVKFPFGDKVETPSDNKLIKEGADCEDCKECDKKELKEDSDLTYGGGLLKEIYNQYVSLNMEDEFFEDCLNKMNISDEELKAWYDMGEMDECAKPKNECDKVEKDNKEEK